MLQASPSDIFRLICQHLDILSTNRLTFVSKELRNSILNDEIFWKSEFEICFPHLLNKVTRKGNPKSWYLVYEKSYFDEYGISATNKNNLQEAFEKAALLTVAKKGDAAKFRRLSKGELQHLALTHDKNGYSCYYWLYRNNHQFILNNIFAEGMKKENALANLELAIKCNQVDYLKKYLNSKNSYSLSISMLLLEPTVKGGSLTVIELVFNALLKKFQDHPFFHTAKTTSFHSAVASGFTDIANFLYKQMMEGPNKEIYQSSYKPIMWKAFHNAISSNRKETFENLLNIYDENKFDVNYKANRTPPSLLCVAACQEDPSYVEGLLEVGAIRTSDANEPSPIIYAVEKGNYETLVALLKNETHQFTQNKKPRHSFFEDSGTNELIKSNYEWLKNWFNKKPLKADPYMRALVNLMLYRYELKVKREKDLLSTLTTTFSSIFSSQNEEPNKQFIDQKICDILFNIIIKKRPSTDLDTLSKAERSVLEDPKRGLHKIYIYLLGTIQNIRGEENLAKKTQLADCRLN